MTRRIVHVVDDDEAVRKSIGFLLTSENIPSRLHANPLDLLKGLPDESAGCIVTDVRMPEMDGLGLQRRLKELAIDLPLIVITGHADLAVAVTVLKAGAVDFIEKPVDDVAFLAAVRGALERRDRGADRATLLATLRDRIASLSVREKQVMDKLVLGQPNKVIAHEIGISPRTVEIHRGNLMLKMQAESLSELVRFALLLEEGR